MNKANKINISFESIVLSFLFLASMRPWPLWGIETIYVNIVFVLIVALKRGPNAYFRNFGFINVLFLIAILWLHKGANFFGYIEGLIQWLLISYLLGIDECKKLDIVRVITKVLAILSAISLIVYLYVIVGGNFPHYIDQFGDYRYEHENYIFFVRPLEFHSVRFSSIFAEPGFFTMGVATLLYLNKYDIKDRYVQILFIAQLFSFSLAGYVVLIIGYVLAMSTQGKEMLKMSNLLPILAVILFSTVSMYLFSEDLIESLIVERLQLADGTLVGDNRSSIYLDYVYEQTINSNDIWYGSQKWDASQSEKGMAGYKLFLVLHGVIGIALWILSYLFTVLKHSEKYLSKLGLLVVLFLLLYQNAYPDWWCMLIVCILGPSCLKVSSKEGLNLN